MNLPDRLFDYAQMDDHDSDEAVIRQRLFDSAVETASARNIHVAPDEIDASIEQALSEVRADRFGKRCACGVKGRRQ